MAGRTRAERILRAVENEVWALHPPKLAQLAEILIAKAETGQIPTAAEVAALDEGQRGGVKRSGSVAVVPLVGTISKRMGMLDAMSGGCSIDAFVDTMRALGRDPDVSAILINIHSPGGSVYGVEEAFRAVYALRGEKRVVAIANALCASAAYYVASAAEELIVTPSGEPGSIGVYTIHFDYSQALEAEGIKATIIRAGEHKAEGNPYEPLDEDARQHTQSIIDAYYRQFVRAVAKGRGVSPAKVEKDFGQGRTFDAARAVQLGLADRVATLEETVDDLVRGRKRGSRVAASASGQRVAATAAEPLTDLAATLGTAASLFAATLPGGSGAEMLAAYEEGERLAARTKAIGELLGLAVPEITDDEDEEDDDEDQEDEASHAAGGAASASIAAPTQPAPAAQGEPMSGVDTAAPPKGPDTQVGADALAADRKRAGDIIEMCRSHNLAEKASGWVAEGLSTDQVGRRILEHKERERPGSTLPKADPPVTLTPSENKRYSIARLMGAIADNKPQMAGFEMEIDAELRGKMNYAPKGVLVPTNLGSLERKAALTSGGATAGEELVFIEPGSFIEMLRSRLVLAAMGATFIPGLRGNVDFPKQTGAGTFTWVEEAPGSDAPGDSDIETGTVSLRPKNGRSITSFSRTLLAQAVINVEQLVRRDLAAITARGIDLAGLHGTGANNQPTGVYVANGVHPVAFDGEVSYPKIVEMETVIAEADADIERMGYVSTPGLRGGAKTTLTFPAANTGMPIWQGGVQDGEMNGYRAMASTQIRKDLGVGSNEHGIVFGAWEHLLIGEWGAMDVLVDPYTRGGRGLIRVIVFAIADVALRYPEAFSKATGLTVATDAS